MENEPLLNLFDGFENNLVLHSSKYALVWEGNKDILKPYFKDRTSFAQFVARSFNGKDYTLEQVIKKRIKTYRYKQLVKSRENKL